MIVLGIILVLLDLLLLHTQFLFIIGIVLIIVGALAWFVPVSGRRHRWY